MTLTVVILNYRTPELTIGALASLKAQVESHNDRQVVVVDNDSRDGSIETISKAVADHGWAGWASMIGSPENVGFAGGNNLGIQSAPADAYLLMNSDAIALPGLLDALLRALRVHPEAGVIGPRILDADGQAMPSCFRFPGPISEFLAAAATGPITALLHRHVVAMPVSAIPIEPGWISFSCVLLRAEMIREVGLLDDAFFMYYEDVDYCHRVWQSRWRVRYEPSIIARHLHARSSGIGAAKGERRSLPRYFYESRSRYFARHRGGRVGLAAANLAWMSGRWVSVVRESIGNKTPHTCRHAWRDNWTNWLRPDAAH